MKRINPVLALLSALSLLSPPVTAAEISEDKSFSTPVIEEVVTEYGLFPVVTLDIRGRNFLRSNGRDPYVSLGDGQVFLVDFIADNELVLTAELPDGDYLLRVSHNKYFRDNYTVDYDLTIGAVGPVGPPGSDGKDGTDGKNGADGKDGVDGDDGADGKDGVDGKDGIDGVDGKDGVMGPPGPPGDPASISWELLHQLNLAHCQLAGLSSYADVVWLLFNGSSLPVDDAGNPDYFSELFEEEGLGLAVRQGFRPRLLDLPTFCFDMCPANLPVNRGGSVVASAVQSATQSDYRSRTQSTGMEYVLESLVTRLVLIGSSYTNGSGFNDRFEQIRTHSPTMAVSEVNAGNAINDTLTGISRKTKSSNRLEYSPPGLQQAPADEETPLQCITSILARVIGSVDAGCDPDGYYIEQTLVNLADFVESYWQSTGWSEGTPASFTSRPDLFLFIDGQNTGTTFSVYGDGYVFSDPFLENKDGMGYFSMSVASIDYEDRYKLKYRCRISDTGDRTDCVTQTFAQSCYPDVPAN